ncbi:DUF1273 domain-containing protein [Periweissella ghanensis]|uniref:UPF0398 protein WGH24286_00899 n=1 Tax=Periweissella ghanensis TaxID=467997 RepID=A0ABN8BPE3_9LACO|nr:DUF1273 domain-containing protein [Periweissella ghanensis]MCM0600629.1 DUF1273 domain-containing protein [Periweissella ghanensis]CAH0418481.1 hypothetical protein WGH24286_00899 [Periweissella ghanensis]
MTRLWVTGYRAYELGVFKNDDLKVAVIKYALKRELINQFEQGVDWIITGPQLGIEQWTIEVVNELKADYAVQVAMMAPYLNVEKNWQEEKQAQLAQLKTQVDYYASVSAQEYQNPSQLKGYQSFMLTHTDAALLIYDPEFEGKTKYDYFVITNQQNSQNYPWQSVSFDDLQEYAFAYGEEQESDKNY